MVASVLRVYDSAPGLVEALESHMDEIEGLFRGVNGFRSWTYHRTDAGGGFSLTVCDDKAGCDESVKLAANWIRENMPNASAISPPVITEATAVVRITPTERLTGGQPATA